MGFCCIADSPTTGQLWNASSVALHSRVRDRHFPTHDHCKVTVQFRKQGVEYGCRRPFGHKVILTFSTFVARPHFISRQPCLLYDTRLLASQSFQYSALPEYKSTQVNLIGYPQYLVTPGNQSSMGFILAANRIRFSSMLLPKCPNQRDRRSFLGP